MSIRKIITAGLAASLWSAPALAQSLEFGPPYTLAGGFENPFGVAVNGAPGHLLVSDTRNRQIRWTTLASLAGTPTFQSFGHVADPAHADALIDPQGLAADGAGNVYVVDARRNQVNRYAWNGTNSTYQLDANFASATRNAVASVAIESPRDIAVAPDGKVYLLDSGRKRVLRADGPADTSWEVFKSDPTLGNPYGIEVGPDGRVYVADTDHHRIVRYEADGTSTTFGRFGTGAGEFRFPRDVAVDIDGRMYVADTHNHRVVLLDANGRYLFSLGRAPTFAFIQKVALDAQRRLFIADSDRNSVIAFLGRDAPAPFDGWLRDYLGDAGAQPSDPAFTLASPDLLVRRSPDVDLTAAQANGLESIAFENPRYDQDNHVYVAVRNRGTQDLRDAVVLLYWADQGGALAFPADWKTDGFFDGPAPTASNHRLEVPPVPAGGTVVLGPLRFRPPAPETASLGNGAFVLGARLVHPFDVALSAAGPAAVRASNNVAIRPLRVVRGPFPTGDQNTLVVRVRYADDPTPIGEAATQARIDQLVAWTNEVSWGKASVRPLLRGELTLPQSRAHYTDPGRSRLVEMANDALALLLGAEPDLLGGATSSPADDIARLVLVTNDTTADVDFATSGPWPYQTSAGEHYLTVSVQGMNNSAAAFQHGLGHQLGMLDLYAYPNVSFPRPFAEGWDNMAKPFNGVHPTVWSKQLADWVTGLGAQIVFVPRPARGARFTQQAIPLAAQTDAAAGRKVAIALGLTPGVGTFTDETAFYFVEARAKAGADAALADGGLLVYYVNTRIPQGQGPVIVRDHGTSTPGLHDATLHVGQSETPAGTGITVTYAGTASGAAGTSHLVDIDYAPPPTGYDVSIDTGNPGWTSPDIWVDNQSDGYDEVAGRVPSDRGDVAVGNEENRIYARVHNAGPADAFDVEVAFFISEPYHTVGGEADFTFLKSVVIPRLAPGDTTVHVPWMPTVNDPHTCVKVVLRRLLDDTNGANNAAQQNLEVKWSTSSSPHQPVDFNFQVTNPDPVPRLVYFRADQVPAGWDKQFTPAKVLLQPNQRFTGSLRLAPPPDAKNCTRHDIAVTAWTPESHTLVRMGGTTVRVNLAKQADLTLATELVPCTREEIAEGERAAAETKPPLTHREPERVKPVACVRLRASGCTDPRQPNAEVVVRYLDPAGQPVYRTVRTDANGCYEDFFATAEGGDWTIGASIAQQGCLAPAVATETLVVPTPGEAEPARVSPSSYEARGKLKLLARGGKRCATCRRIDTEHALDLRLQPARGGAATLSAKRLATAFDDAGRRGVFAAPARMVTADGTVLEGEIHGVMNAAPHRPPGARATPWRIEGQFRALAVDGKNPGCRALLQFAAELDADPARGGAGLKGLAEGLEICACGPSRAASKPLAEAPPDGCVMPFSAAGEGVLATVSESLQRCGTDDRRSLQRAGAARAQLTPAADRLDPRFLPPAAEFRVARLHFAHAREADSPGLHGGSFELVGPDGSRIRGRLEGIANADVHRRTGAKAPPRHLEGALQGRVEGGPLEGCELRAVYSADYAPGKTEAPSRWSLDGAIVCACRNKPREDASAFGRRPFSPLPTLELTKPAKAEAPPARFAPQDKAAAGALARKQFADWDRNGDGRLSRAEFVAGQAAAFGALSGTGQPGAIVGQAKPGRPLPPAAAAAADRNADGLLDPEELREWARRNAEQLFRQIDRKDAGYLNPEQFINGMPRAGLLVPEGQNRSPAAGAAPGNLRPDSRPDSKSSQPSPAAGGVRGATPRRDAAVPDRG